MTFTSTTIRELRALGLDQETFDKVLDIFERARESKPKKKAAAAADRAQRGTRLPENWQLPAEWREYAIGVGLHALEVNREAVKFKAHWLNAAGDKGLKLRWDQTWRTWCLKALEYMGRAPRVPDATGGGVAAPKEGPEAFTDATWRAIAKRYKSSGNWNVDWGPPPGRMDCLMPVSML